MPLHGFYNHAVHTAPIIVILIECIISNHRLPSSFGKGVLGWTLYGVTYLSWIMWIAYHQDIWVYPFMRVMNGYQIGIFFAFIFVFGALLHKIVVAMTSMCWGCERKEKVNWVQIWQCHIALINSYIWKTSKLTLEH